MFILLEFGVGLYSYISLGVEDFDFSLEVRIWR